MTLEEFKEIMKRRGTDEIIESLKNGKIESYEIINEILKQKLSGRNPERRLVVEADKFKHIWGVTYSDISELDLSGFSKEEMLRLNFSLLTKWPSKDKMPEGFNPEKIIKCEMFHSALNAKMVKKFLSKTIENKEVYKN